MTELKIISSVTFHTYNGIIVFENRYESHSIHFLDIFFFYYNYNTYIHLINLDRVIKGRKLHVLILIFAFFNYFIICVYRMNIYYRK